MVVESGPIQRFAEDWYKLIGDSQDRALVALSGGPDSTALLLLLHALIGDRCIAATVDHRLRSGSAAEAERAAALCRARGIGHAVLTGQLPDRAGRTANLHTRARALRYASLEAQADAVGARWIVTAHHADDQLETLIMRLNRGAGVRGLAGVRAIAGRVVRPLLGWGRAELAAVVAAAGITPVEDPSNTDDRFARARVRKDLAGADWLHPLAAGRSAAALADADAALDWAADRLAAERCRLAAGVAALAIADVPVELRRRLVARCLVHVDPDIAVRGTDLTRLLATLGGGGTGTLGRVRCASDGDLWTFREAPSRRSL